MKDTKLRFETFSFFDYTNIALHLSKMAEKGWLLTKISVYGWTYRRIEPKKMEFFVSYYPKASEFDPEPTEEQKEFHDFCEHTGWMLAATSAQMQIFYNERENPTPIETDPLLEITTLHAAAKKSFLPSYFLLLFLSIFDIALFVSRLLGDLVGTLASAANLFTGVAWSMLFLICAMELCGYSIWYRKAKKAAERGEFIKTPNHSRKQKIILAAVLICFVYWLITVVLLGNSLMRTIGLAMVFYIITLIVLVNGIKGLLKRRKVPKDLNRIITVISSFVLSFSMMGAITFSALRASQNGLFDRNRETYEYNGATFTIYMDELPLTVEDLIDVPYEGYIRERRSEESLLLGQFVMWQRPRFDSEHFIEMPGLLYTITEVKLPFLYDFCKTSLLNSQKDTISDGQTVFVNQYQYEPIDPIPWLADDAYKLTWSSRYLLCYESRIIELTLDWEPTEEQMKVVGEKLGH